MADDHDRISTRLVIFLGSEKTAQQRFDAERLKIIAGGVVTPYEIVLARLDAHADGLVAACDQAGKRLVPVAKFDIVRI